MEYIVEYNPRIWENKEDEWVTYEDFNRIEEGISALSCVANSNVSNTVAMVKHTDLDATSDIQNALDSIESTGGTVLLESGTYEVSDILYIPSNTTIEGVGDVVLKCAGTQRCMLTNKYDLSIGGYDMSKNITIKNVTFDGDYDNKTHLMTLVAFQHTTNLIIENCTFRNCYTWHMLELNSTYNGIVRGCKFEKYGKSGSGYSEMLQIDFPYSGTWVDSNCVFDETPCTHILVENCIFDNEGIECGRGVGNHSQSSTGCSSDITIRNCYFANLDDGIKFVCAKDLTIEGNTMYNTAHGVFLSSWAWENINILNNYIDCNSKQSSLDNQNRGIFVQGKTDNKSQYINIICNTVKNTYNHGITCDSSTYVTISNNHVTGCYNTGLWVGYDCENVTCNGNTSFGNNTSNNPNRSDIAIGGGDTSNKITVTCNTIGTALIGYGGTLTNAIISNNVIDSIVSTNGSPSVHNNIINGTYVS